MAKPKLTLTRFYPSHIKPARAGWYETDITTGRPKWAGMRFWNGRWWSFDADRSKKSATQNWLWRGLAKEPK